MSNDRAEQPASVVPPPLLGVEQSEEVLEWMWTHFSAVGQYLRTPSIFALANIPLGDCSSVNLRYIFLSLLHQGPQQAYFLAAYAGWQLSDLPIYNEENIPNNFTLS